MGAKFSRCPLFREGAQMTIGAVVLGAIDRPADRSLQLVYEERYLNTNTIQRVFGHVAWVAVVLFAFTVCVRLALGFKFGLLLRARSTRAMSARHS